MAWQSLIVLGVVAIPAIAVWVTPTLEQTALLLLLGALMYGVQWSSIRAHRDRGAAALAPLEYTRLIYAAAIGYIVFDTVPDWSTLIAAVLIIGGALIVTWRPAEPADDMSRI
jgi:drug/metabolite transporter (DMT)-like permease